MTPSAAGRIAWVDVAKALGIVLVFYEHFVDITIWFAAPVARPQAQWICSFHMPLFFFLAGVVYRPRRMPARDFVVRQFRQRLVPVGAFTAVAMLIWALHASLAGLGPAQISAVWLREAFALLLRGRSEFSGVTWFLVCLCVVELWQYALEPVLGDGRRLIVSASCFAFLVAVLNWLGVNDSHPFGNPWRTTSAVGGMAFYQLGIITQRHRWALPGRSRVWACIVGALALGVSLATFRLNRPAGDGKFMVLMVDPKYGEAGWFFLTSLAGILFVTHLSGVLSTSRVLQYVGRITLALMCLHGLLHQFVNPHVSLALGRSLRGSGPWTLTGVCILYTAACVALCVPVTRWLAEHAPFMIDGHGRRRPAAGASA